MAVALFEPTQAWLGCLQAPLKGKSEQFFNCFSLILFCQSLGASDSSWPPAPVWSGVVDGLVEPHAVRRRG